MDMSSLAVNTTTPKRYYISMKVLRSRALMVIAALAAAPLLLALAGEEVDGLMIGLFAGLMAMSLVIFFVAARMAWMTMDANGLVYKGIGFKLVTSWDNIDSIGTKFMMNEGTVEGLKLVESGLEMNPVIKTGLLFSWSGTMAMRQFSDFIPLSNFQTKEWRDTEFGQELRRYIPRIFEDGYRG